MDKSIDLIHYGANLGSRILAREVCKDFYSKDIDKYNAIVINFENVRAASLSFITELVDFLYDNQHFEIVKFDNVSRLISIQIDFAVNNTKGREKLENYIIN